MPKSTISKITSRQILILCFLGEKGDLHKFGSMIPPYPEVYDYYKVHHLLNLGVPSAHDQDWEYLLSMANRKLGPEKQVNLIVVLVPTDDPAYVYAFRDKWLGGKKNDSIILIGAKDGHNIDWVDVVSWTTDKEYAVYVRDRILGIKNLDRRNDIVDVIVQETNQRFVRMHMKNMKWLVRGYQPSSTAMVWLLIIGIVTLFGTCYATIEFRKNS